MVMFHRKVLNILKKPSQKSESLRTLDTVDKQDRVKDINLKNFPAGRITRNCTPKPADRILTSNMTGQISLTGESFNLHFTKGTLKKLSSNDTVIFDKLNSRTRFKTNYGTVKYRNESAFAFEGNDDYGLRTLQVPKKNSKSSCRVITDYTFSRDADDAVITITADYPEFRKKSKVQESSVFEFRIENKRPEGIRISSDCSDEITVRPETYSKFSIKGNVFRFFTGESALELEISNSASSGNFSRLNSLSLKSSVVKGTSVIFINPGGSYCSAPAEYYSGIHEQLRFKLRLIEA